MNYIIHTNFLSSVKSIAIYCPYFIIRHVSVSLLHARKSMINIYNLYKLIGWLFCEVVFNMSCN